MTNFDWILVLAIGISLGYLLRVAIKKAPQLSIVNPMSSREAQARERKNSLLEARMMRQVGERGRTVWKTALRPIFHTVRDAFRRIAGKLTALERRYVERQRGGGGTMDASALHRMVEEAKTAIGHERFDLAEQRLIAVVSHDPRHTEAYEVLGRMYLSQGQYAEAKEALEFLAKLVPNDASVMIALGQVHEELGEKKIAHEYYSKGRDISPNNPKYLDFFIQSAITVGEYHEAQVAIDHLSKVNPENQKIAVFEKMLIDARS